MTSNYIIQAIALSLSLSICHVDSCTTISLYARAGNDFKHCLHCDDDCSGCPVMVRASSCEMTFFFTPPRWQHGLANLFHTCTISFVLFWLASGTLLAASSILACIGMGLMAELYVFLLEVRYM